MSKFKNLGFELVCIYKYILHIINYKKSLEFECSVNEAFNPLESNIMNTCLADYNYIPTGTLDLHISYFKSFVHMFSSYGLWPKYVGQDIQSDSGTGQCL